MGCDIHLICAELAPNQSVVAIWAPQDYDDNCTSRNYNIFSALNGVRGSSFEENKCWDRGIHPSIKRIVANQEVETLNGNRWLGDHSLTWYTVGELKNVVDWEQMPDSEELPLVESSFYKWLYSAFPTDRDDERIIVQMGFDS